MIKLAFTLPALLASGFALAGSVVPTAVPLPGVLGLLAAGGAGALVVWMKNKRK